MKQPVFEGLATAIVTPFRNGTIDIPTFEKLLDAQLAANVDAIVICGTTGESATLSSSEQLTLIAHAMQYTAGRCKIIAGTGSNDTAHAIDLSRAASSMGVSAVLIVTPYYNKCTQAVAQYARSSEVAETLSKDVNMFLRERSIDSKEQRRLEERCSTLKGQNKGLQRKVKSYEEFIEQADKPPKYRAFVARKSKRTIHSK